MTGPASSVRNPGRAERPGFRPSLHGDDGPCGRKILRPPRGRHSEPTARELGATPVAGPHRRSVIELGGTTAAGPGRSYCPGSAGRGPSARSLRGRTAGRARHHPPASVETHGSSGLPSAVQRQAWARPVSTTEPPAHVPLTDEPRTKPGGSPWSSKAWNVRTWVTPATAGTVVVARPAGAGPVRRPPQDAAISTTTIRTVVRVAPSRPTARTVPRGISGRTGPGGRTARRRCRLGQPARRGCRARRPCRPRPQR